MYQTNDIDLWRRHREELFREARDSQLARRLKAARPVKAAWRWHALLGRSPALVEAAGDLRESRCA